MKKLTIILTLCVLSISGKAQPQMEFGTYIKTSQTKLTPDYGVKYKHESTKTAWQITGVAVFATITEAVGDGLYDQGKSEGNQDKMMLGKGLQAVSLASHFLYIPIMQKSSKSWLWAPVAEIGIRTLLFDLAYNITRELPVQRIGNTTYWDKILKGTKQQERTLMFGRIIVCTFTVSLTFNQFNN